MTARFKCLSFKSTRLDYSNALLFGVSKHQMQQLQRIQNMAARIVTQSKKYEHITPVLQTMHWLPIQVRMSHVSLLTCRRIHSREKTAFCNWKASFGPHSKTFGSRALTVSAAKTLRF